MRRFILFIALACCIPAAGRASTPPVYTVHIKNFSYKPTPLQITVGETVKFVNDDQEAHTVTATDKSFDSAGLDTGDTWSYTFKKPGRYAYFCALHPWMKAVIVVTNAKGGKS